MTTNPGKPRLLSRSAQGLYWMGRYLDRAEHLCRLLRFQVEALVDRPIREIYFGWSRIYMSLNRRPPGGSITMVGNDDFTLADDLTFERSNPDSVWNCFSLGRENARQMRHCISGEMWTCLNLAYLRLQKLSIRDIWKTSPESFYSETAGDINTFAGVAEATMYRDEGWHFLRLGRCMERAQYSASLFLSQLSMDKLMDESSDADWTNLLHVCKAFDAYGRNYSVDVQSRRVLDLLVTDPLLHGSVCYSLDAVAAELNAIGPGSDEQSSAVAQRLARRMCALIHYDWPDREDHEALLGNLIGYCRELHDLVTAAYKDSFQHWDFTHPSAMAKPSAVLADFTDRNGIARGNDPLRDLIRLSDTLHSRFQYAPGSTSAASPIEEILNSGHGVCQDYATL